MNTNPNAEKSVVTTDQPLRVDRKAAVVGLVLLVLMGGIYIAKIYPDVKRGDSAEIQFMTVLLGVCHPPGYGLQVMAGNLFSRLPLGNDAAWRLNLMMAVCGAIGVATLYWIVHRMTGRIVPAIAAALTLAFSITWWMHCEVTEVYVFHAMFLLLGIGAALRYLATDRTRWLFLMALLLGVCIGSRLSELSVLPAFVVLWWGSRRKVRLSWVRLVAAGAVAVIPFMLNVAFFLWRENPGFLHARDDALRDEILQQGPPVTALSSSERLKEAVMYSLGLRGAGRKTFTELSWWRIGWDLNKYGWQLSGLAAGGDRFPADAQARDRVIEFRQREQGSGTSITVLGAVLALAGLRHWRRHKHVLLFGILLFFGNSLYYLYMHPVDNLQFTLPGLIGLALLIGWGLTPRASDTADSRKNTDHGDKRRLWPTRLLYATGFIPPIFLFATNLAVLDYRKPEMIESMALAKKIMAVPLPPKPVIVATYPRAQRLRFLYWVEAGRRDVAVIVFREQYEPAEARRLAEGLRAQGYTVLFSAEVIGKVETQRVFAQWTPRQLVELGLFFPYPSTR